MLAEAHIPRNADSGAVGTNARIALEVESNYNPPWTFKGQTQSVKSAARNPYRFPVYKNDRLVYWQSEYLLIGFAGADGGG
jgi:hypothetical protein